MYYRHGSFSFETGEVDLRGSSKVMLPSARGRPMLVRNTLALGFQIVSATQSAITARFIQIRDALNINAVSSGFVQDNGNPSAIYLDNAASFSGVLVTQLPALQPLNGADYATGHVGAFSVQADFIPPNADQLLDYRESYTMQGRGGPLVVAVITDVGPPLLVQTAQQTPRQATQAGYAVGHSTWPFANGPFWGPPILQDPAWSVTLETPRVNGNGVIEYRTSWNYSFLADRSIDRFPLIK